MIEIINNSNRFLFKIDSRARSRLWRKLSTLIGHGVPILDAVSSIHSRRMASGNDNHPMTIALGNWKDKLKNGLRISQAIEGWVYNEEQMLISAGEQSGNLEKALISASEIMQAKKKIRKSVWAGLFYPTFAILIAIGVMIMFSYKIIPSFTGLVADEKWSGTGRAMIDISNFTRDWIWLFGVIAITLIVAFFVSLPRWTGGLRIQLDRYPPYNIYRMLQGSTWMISFAALVSAGVRVENALVQLSEGASPWLYARVQACLKGTRSGLTAGDALAKSGYGFPDREIIDDLGVYSKLDGFDSALEIIGKEWITESVESIDSMMKVIFVISIAVAGGLIAFMVSGLIVMELQLAEILKSAYQ